MERVYSSFFISKDYFVSLTCFLTFNLFAVLGNVLPSYISWVREAQSARSNPDHDLVPALGRQVVDPDPGPGPVHPVLPAVQLQVI